MFAANPLCDLFSGTTSDGLYLSTMQNVDFSRCPVILQDDVDDPELHKIQHGCLFS
jgi:hypothetical protein